jgi:hypothetical protein
MYILDVVVFGDGEQELYLQNVPVVVANMNRKLFIIGRRGILEKLEVNLDFPNGIVNLPLARSSSAEYPSLSQHFPNLDRILESLHSGNSAVAVMMLAWEIKDLWTGSFKKSPFRERVPKGEDYQCR